MPYPTIHPRLPLQNGRLTTDPTRWMVFMPYPGKPQKTMYGEIIGHHWNDTLGATFIDVHYFNGSPWPNSPLPAISVRVLERKHA